MTKRIVMLCLLPMIAVAQSGNILPNASFDQAPDRGASAKRVQGWTPRAWSGKAEARWTVETPGRQDKGCVSIQSPKGTDAAWTASVTVKRQTRYELSGWIKTRDIRGAKGALFNIQGVAGSTTRAIAGSTDWTRVVVVFNSGNKTTLEVNCLFGGWGRSTGQAWYDDVVLRQAAESTHNSGARKIPGTLRGREGLQAVPAMAKTSMPKPILGVGVSANGTVYVTETIRQMREEISLIQSGGLHEADMALNTTTAKKQWILENYAKRRINGRQGVQDFNKDGKIDEKDLTVRSEKIYTLQDSDGDGLFDKSTLFADGFKDTLTGVAHSVTPIGDDVYATIIPDLWKLTDTNNDGVADRRESIAHGFAPHIGYGNHDLHSIVQGYDGKLYWSMGDRGVSVVRKDGRPVSNPHSGTILRSNPDGSDFEVFAYGLRNCQYFDFDDYGNIFSVDHDADFQGERERLVYLPEGSDSGWRMYYQYRNTTGLVRAAREDLYNPWLAEKMWIPFHAGQPSHILPPIENSWNAPASFSWQPGTALGSKYAGHFLLGGKGDIRAFRMVADGATFKRDGGDEPLIRGFTGQVLTSTFAPNGKLYFSIWKPRPIQTALWTLEAPATPAMARVETLLSKGFKSHRVEQLLALLGDGDRRLRQQAQFELVARGEATALRKLAMNTDVGQFPRLHSLWALGQLAHKDAELLAALCADDDSELRAQVARWAGELRFDPHNRIVALVRDPSPRVQLMAALACGKLKNPHAVAPLTEMLVAADNRVPVLRHAGVVGLAGAATPEQLVAFADHPSEALRIAAVIALRRQKAITELVPFLKDKSPQVVIDAACAIYDDATADTFTQNPRVLRALAETLDPDRPIPVNVRALAANRRLGTVAAAKRIVAFLATPKLAPALQIEALYTLESWLETPTLDPVDGRYLPVPAGTAAALRTAIGPAVWTLAGDVNHKVSKRAIALLRQIEPSQAEQERVATIVLDTRQRDALRIQWLRWLRAQAPALFESVGVELLSDKSPMLRATAARELKSARRADEAVANYLLATLSKSRDPAELQQAIRALPGLRAKEKIVSQLLDDLIAGTVAPEVQLEVIEIAAKVPPLKAKLEQYQATIAKKGVMAQFGVALQGGNARAGDKLFRTPAQAQCSKCHAIKLTDKQVGPSLQGIGKRQAREYLLQSIVDPQAKIVPGYGVVGITLKDGSIVGGTVMEETGTSLTVKLADGSEQLIPKNTIQAQSAAVGMMPDLKSILTPRQIRDLVAYLATL